MSEQQNEVAATPAAEAVSDETASGFAPEAGDNAADAGVVGSGPSDPAELPGDGVVAPGENVEDAAPEAEEPSEERQAAEAPQAEIESADADKDPSGGDIPEHAKSPLTSNDVIYPGGEVVASEEHVSNQLKNTHPENGLVKNEDGLLVPNEDAPKEERGQSGSVETGLDSEQPLAQG